MTATRTTRGVLVLLVLAGAVAAGGPAAASGAAGADPVCAGAGGDGDRYDVSTSPLYLPRHAPGARAYASAGTTIVMSTSRPFDVEASPGTTAAVDADAVLARVSEVLEIPVATSASVGGGGGSGSWTVPPDQGLGWLEVGGAGYQVDWRRGTCSPDGAFTVVGSGTMQAATRNASFTHS